MKTYDFSRGASSVQRALFALWGIVQLVVAWNLVRRIERTGSSVVISLNSGDEVHLLDLVPVGPERADGVDALWEDMRARAEARNVPFDLR